MSSLDQHTDYEGPRLDEAEFGLDPFLRFREWLAAAEEAEIPEPNAMVLGTVEPDGSPSSRTVLLKALDGDRFRFVTNAGSRKGRALAADARMTLLFPWYALRRQVIVTGRAAPASDEVSDEYWASRPRKSNLGALASEQSAPIASRAALEQRLAETAARYEGVEALPRPPHWGGWEVEPATIEFWQGQRSRMHDRLLLERAAAAAAAWTVRRLQP